MRSDHSRTLWCCALLVLTACGNAQDRSSEPANDRTATEPKSCAEHRAQSYAAVYTAKYFSSASAAASTNESTPRAVIALRCLVQEGDALRRLNDLASRGTLPGQLYAMVGLRALDQEEFRRRLPPYLSNSTVIEIEGDDRAARFPASEIASGISPGLIVKAFLPALVHLVPEAEPQGWISAPE